MTSTRMCARGIIEYQGKFLLVKNASSSGDFWCLPGGGIESGEDVVSALRREIIEETGVVPDIGNLLYVHQIGQPGNYSVPEFLVHIRNGKDFSTIDLKKTSHGEEELLAIDFIDITSATVLPKFLKTELPELATRNFEVPTRFRLSE
jgi:8-oxo-dGTP diphosphatase